MRKKVIGQNVYYSIGWSTLYKYDKHSALRILPELPGILYFYTMKGPLREDILCFGCWREGLRMGMRDLFDPYFAKHEYVHEQLKELNLYYKYCIVDTTPADMRDVMYYLIKTNFPRLNNAEQFADSKRYHEIFVKEETLGANSIKLETSKLGF